MSNLSRLHTDKIQNGKPVDATFISAELDQLINGHNNQKTQLDGQATNLENINNQPFTFNGEKTFANGIKTDTVAERTANAGITLDGVLLKDGLVLPSVATAPASPTAGSMWYQQNTQQHMLRNGVASRPIAPLTQGYIGGPTPFYVNDNSVRFYAGTCALDDTHTRLMTLSSDVTPSLLTTGAGGLDTGVETADTWYFPWLCAGSSGTTVVWSASETTPTLPSGFNTYKRWLPFAVRNDASGNFLRFQLTGWGSTSPMVLYNDAEMDAVGSVATGRHVIVSGGTSTAFTYVTASTLVPPGAKSALINVTTRSNSVYLRFLVTSGTVGLRIPGVTGFDVSFPHWIGVTTSSRNFQYRVDGNSTHLAVLGYVMQIV
jgi:hypothetical protein